LSIENSAVKKLIDVGCSSPNCEGKLYQLKHDYYLVPVKPTGQTILHLHAKAVKVFQCNVCDSLHFVSAKSNKVKWKAENND